MLHLKERRVLLSSVLVGVPNAAKVHKRHKKKKTIIGSPNVYIIASLWLSGFPEDVPQQKDWVSGEQRLAGFFTSPKSID